MPDQVVLDWCLHARLLARCLMASIPDVTDEGYGETAARFIDRRPAQVDENRPEGTWVRGGLGYFFIGPSGQPHFYTRVRPEGVADADMVTWQAAPPGRLIADVRTAAIIARRLSLGEPATAMGLGKQSFTCAKADRDVVVQTQTLLEGTLSAVMPAYNRGVLREHAGLIFDHIAKRDPEATAVAASRDKVLALRQRFAADGWLTTLVLTRAGLSERIPAGTAGADRLQQMSMDGSGVFWEPEYWLRQVVLAYTEAGHAALVLEIIETALGDAKAAKDAALAAMSIDLYAEKLYEAAQHGLLAWLLADLMVRIVPPTSWPESLLPEKMTGYLGRAEEYVVRTAAALQVACINALNRAALNDHISQVKERGAAWADELIDGFYYYPSCVRPLLLGQAAAA